MKTNKLTLLTVATIATATRGEASGTESTVEQPTAKNPDAEAGSESNDHNQSGNATQFTKNGSDIQVTNFH